MFENKPKKVSDKQRLSKEALKIIAATRRTATINDEEPPSAAKIVDEWRRKAQLYDNLSATPATNPSQDHSLLTNPLARAMLDYLQTLDEANRTREIELLVLFAGALATGAHVEFKERSPDQIAADAELHRAELKRVYRELEERSLAGLRPPTGDLPGDPPPGADPPKPPKKRKTG